MAMLDRMSRSGHVPQNDVLLERLMDHSSDWVAAVDRQFTIIFCNQAFQLAFRKEFGAEVAAGTNLLDALAHHPSERDETAAACERAFQGEAFTVTRALIAAENEQRHVEFSYQPLCDDSGPPVGAAIFGRDVTARRRAEEELARLTQEMELRISQRTTEVEEAAERLRAVVNTAVDGIITIDERGFIETINPAVTRIFGYSAEELIGRNVSSLMPEPDRSQHNQYLANYLRTGERKIIGIGREVVGLRKDGSTFPLELAVSETRLGSRMLFTGIVRDITERKRAEERFRLAVEASPSGQVMVNHEGMIVLVNSATEKMFGYTRAELLGESIDKLVPARFRERHPAYRNDFFASPQVRAMGAGRDLFGLRQDGTEFPVEIGLNPIETDEGMFVLSAIVDITQRKHAELELRRTAEELARSNAELEQFAYVASHDLQEPLRAVAGCVQLLQTEYQGRLHADADEYIQYAVEGASRMRALINDLLQFSRVGRGGLVLERVDCDTVLSQVLTNLAASIAESGAVVTHDPLPTVLADPIQLAQVFQNLIVNAVKFRGEEPPEIHLGCVRQGGQWVFSVRDNGIGIEGEYLERIFRVFQRLHTRNEYPGSGIGLAICKKVVEQHRGRIWAESQTGNGSTFYFTLPSD